MPHIITGVENAAGRYPFSLYGQEYELAPVKRKTTELKSKAEAKKPQPLETANGEPAQPTTEDNAPHNVDTADKEA